MSKSGGPSGWGMWITFLKNRSNVETRTLGNFPENRIS